MTIRRVVAPLGTAALSLLGACASNLPSYPPMSGADALATIADRQASIRTISAECDLDLTDADGQRIALDGVLVAELPGRVRLRAWKFGQAVFDLTLVEGRVWVMMPDTGPAAGRFSTEAMPSRQVNEAMNLLGTSYFGSARASGGDAVTLRARGTAFGRDDVECEIDRRTLTPRRFVVEGGDDVPRSELTLDRFTMISDTAWPMRMRLRSGTGEVLLRFREVELNTQVPTGAFTPPRRAKALP